MIFEVWDGHSKKRLEFDSENMAEITFGGVKIAFNDREVIITGAKTEAMPGDIEDETRLVFGKDH